MDKVILLTLCQRDSLRTGFPELSRQCFYLGTGEVNTRQYLLRYTTTVENALALRLMGLCSFESQEMEICP
ncbi:hypothetical protein Pcar_3306 [Syntrophotalea carbinolica DSM 2380]|uniref:Uncharacterized protein n=1 Tax=Syntrophotalea carbinolica (strain DSM 2380 / NBRC 103641 / GraBd1) TaxID=338963 RepID=Q0C6L2_SYNC1|nr:hypothetical protein Pcar_3306 [Syntrophotalea carbinolica DSM 2380]